MWEAGDTSTIGMRNLAASAALAAGWTPQEVADRVGVLPTDVTRWASKAGGPAVADGGGTFV